MGRKPLDLTEMQLRRLRSMAACSDLSNRDIASRLGIDIKTLDRIATEHGIALKRAATSRRTA